MRGKNPSKNPAVWTLVLSLFLGSVPFFIEKAWAAASVENLDSQIAIQERTRENLDRQIRQYNETAQKKTKEAQGLLNKITNLRQTAQMAQEQIKLLELRSSKLKNSMQELNQEIERVNRSLESLLVELQGRILNIYKYSAQEELNIFLAAHDAHDALTMAYMLDRMAKQDQKVIEELSKNLQDLEQAKQKLAHSRSQLEAQTQELSTKQEEYASTLSRTNTMLSNAQKEKKKAQAAARDLEQAQHEIGQKILALLDRKKQASLQSTPAKPGGKSAPGPTPGVPQRDYSYMARG